MGKFADELIVKFPDVFESAPEFKEGTVARLIERFIAVMDGTGGKPAVRTLGDSHRYGLRRLQRFPIGSLVAAELTKEQIREHCEFRRLTVCAATVLQDLTALSGVLKYAAYGDDSISVAPLEAARPYLIKHGLIAASTPRERRPSWEEIEALLEHFAQPSRQGRGFKRRIDMVVMTLWQLYSSRRVGESCKLLWDDWSREDQTIVVRGMKDPKRRGKIKTVALPPEAQQLLIALWEIRDPSEPRIFPYRKQSVSAAYTHAKKALGIVNLRLHDSRRQCASRLLELGYSSEQTIMVTGHESVKGAFSRVYARPNPATFKQGPRGMPAAA